MTQIHSIVVNTQNGGHDCCRAGEQRNVWKIGFATSQDGLHFTKGGPIKWTNEPAKMDFCGESGPAVLPNPYDEGYVMAYTAIDKDRSSPDSFYGKWSTGMATSRDGITWTRVGDTPVAEGASITHSIRHDACDSLSLGAA